MAFRTKMEGRAAHALRSFNATKYACLVSPNSFRHCATSLLFVWCSVPVGVPTRHSFTLYVALYALSCNERMFTSSFVSLFFLQSSRTHKIKRMAVTATRDPVRSKVLEEGKRMRTTLVRMKNKKVKRGVKRSTYSAYHSCRTMDVAVVLARRVHAIRRTRMRCA